MGLQAHKVSKPRTKAGKRHIASRAPKLIEHDKNAVFLRHNNASQLATSAIKDLAALHAPHSVMLMDKKDMRPFDNESEVEKFGRKYDASLFGVAMHNKKRPDCLVLGRMFDFHVLDMFELCISNYVPLQQGRASIAAGNRPVLHFAGEEWNFDTEYQRLKNFFVDFFRGPTTIRNIRSTGLTHLISFTIHKNTIFLRTYKILRGAKADETVDSAETEDVASIIIPHSSLTLDDSCGLQMDFLMKRYKIAPTDEFKKCCRKPKELQPKKIKNKETDAFGSKTGRIHMERQDLSKLVMTRSKALKGGRKNGMKDDVRNSNNSKGRGKGQSNKYVFPAYQPEQA